MIQVKLKWVYFDRKCRSVNRLPVWLYYDASLKWNMETWGEICGILYATKNQNTVRAQWLTVERLAHFFKVYANFRHRHRARFPEKSVIRSVTVLRFGFLCDEWLRIKTGPNRYQSKSWFTLLATQDGQNLWNWHETCPIDAIYRG